MATPQNAIQGGKNQWQENNFFLLTSEVLPGYKADWDTASGLTSENTQESDADRLLTHTDILSPVAENWLLKKKNGFSKTFSSLSQATDKVTPFFLDFSL